MKNILFVFALSSAALMTGACTFYAGPLVTEIKTDGGRIVQKVCMSKYESFVGETSLVDCELKPVGKLDKNERISQ